MYVVYQYESMWLLLVLQTLSCHRDSSSILKASEQVLSSLCCHMLWPLVAHLNCH